MDVFQDLQAQFCERTERITLTINVNEKTIEHPIGTLGYGLPGTSVIIPVSVSPEQKEIVLEIGNNITSTSEKFTLDLAMGLNEEIIAMHAALQAALISKEEGSNDEQKIERLKKEALSFVANGKSIQAQQTSAQIQNVISSIKSRDENERRKETASLSSYSYQPIQQNIQQGTSNIQPVSNDSKLGNPGSKNTGGLQSNPNKIINAFQNITTGSNNTGSNSEAKVNVGNNMLKTFFTNPQDKKALKNLSLISEREFDSSVFEGNTRGTSNKISVSAQDKVITIANKPYTILNAEFDYARVLKDALKDGNKYTVMMNQEIAYWSSPGSATIRNPYRNLREALKKLSKDTTVDKKLTYILESVSTLFTKEDASEVYNQQKQISPMLVCEDKEYSLISIGRFIDAKSGNIAARTFTLAYNIASALIDKCLPEEGEVYLYPSWVIVKIKDNIYLIDSKKVYNLNISEERIKAASEYMLSSSGIFKDCLVRFNLPSIEKQSTNSSTIGMFAGKKDASLQENSISMLDFDVIEGEADSKQIVDF